MIEFPKTVTKLGNSAFNKCTNLKSITAKGVTNIGTFCFYCDTALTFIAPSGSYAESFANEKGKNFIPSEELRFDSIVGEDFVYSTPDGKTGSMPIELVEQMWYDYLPINKQPDFMTHGYLIDVVNDNFINGKDFAKIHHTAKYGW